MNNVEKNRILKLHLQEQKAGGASKGGTNTSSSGQYDGNAFTGDGPLNVSGREKDIGFLPDEVDITKGSKGVTFNLKNAGGQETTIPQPLGNESWFTVDGEIIDITGLTFQEVFELLEDLELYAHPLSPDIFLTWIQIWSIISKKEVVAAEIKDCISSGGGNACLPKIFNAFPPNGGDVDMITPPSSDEDEINRPLSLSCCKKCDNGMYTNKCFPLDGDEDCRFPTLEVCEDESEPRLPSMLDIFS